MILDLDIARGVGEGRCEVIERSEMGSDADGGEAGAGGFDAGNEGEHVVDGVGRPCVRVGAGVAGDFGPGAEVERQQFAPGIERFEIVVGHACVVERAGEVEAEIVGGREHAVGSGAGFDGEHPAQDVLLLISWDHVVEHAEDVGLLAEDLLVGIVGDESAGGDPAFGGQAGADVIEARLVARGEAGVAEMLFEVGGFDESAEILEGRDAGLAMSRRRWGFRRREPSR